MIVFDRRQMYVCSLREFGRQLRQLEVMRGEQCMAAVMRQHVARDGPGEREAIEGRGATADFIHEHEACWRCIVENGRRLGHLDHERGTSSGEIVGGADARED